MAIRVTRPVLDQMQAEAKRAAPEECCGILLGCDGLIEEALPASNVAIDRCQYFEIDPQVLVDAHRAARSSKPQVLGYFHSHPTGPAEPSATDREQSSRDGSVWAIVGETGVAFWRDGEAGFVPLSYAIEDG
jgi:proteasome lid subunit RPN8/RPN11